MTDKITIDTILNWFRQSIEMNAPIRPTQWLDSAAKLIILRQDLDEEIAGIKSEIADQMAEYVKDGKPVATAKILANSGQQYKNLLLLESKRDRVDEHCRIAKKRTELNEF